MLIPCSSRHWNITNIITRLIIINMLKTTNIRDFIMKNLSSISMLGLVLVLVCLVGDSNLPCSVNKVSLSLSEEFLPGTGRGGGGQEIPGPIVWSRMFAQDFIGQFFPKIVPFGPFGFSENFVSLF